MLRRMTFAGLVLTAVLVLGSYPVMAADELAAEEPAQDAAQEQAEEKPWSVTLDTTFNSKYIFRGAQVSGDWVLQPSAAFTYKGLTASIWGNMELTDSTAYPGNANPEGDFIEVDYILDYSWSWDPVNMSLGVIYYDFPNTSFASTTELYVAAQLDVLLSPTLTVYQDIDEAEGMYVNLGAVHTFEDIWEPCASASMSADVSAAVGYASSKHNAFYYGSSGSGFTDFLISLGLPVAIGEHWTVTPTLNWSTLLDSSIRSAMPNDDNLWTGLSVTFEF